MENITYKKNNIEVNLPYSLSDTQKKASEEILNYVKNNQDVIVNAICGAGKTELVFLSIQYYINNGKKVAFACPRKDVCIEIYNRLKEVFNNVAMSLIYGGHTTFLEGQLLVLTTHQLFRYKNYFDLLILDEADAFPYYKNDFLEEFLNSSVNGPKIFLSATITSYFTNRCQNIVYVNRRFHNYDLPVPKFKKYFAFNKINVLKDTIEAMKNKQILIFVPTIKVGESLAYKTKIPFIYSSSPQKNELITKFKNNQIKYLITTSILERGMTFFDVQVIVFEANHKLFDESSLIQIAGRVGRKIKAPTGNVFFLATSKTNAIKNCIESINLKNKKS